MLDLCLLQRPEDLVCSEGDAGRRSLCIHELECLRWGSVSEHALPRPQQDRIDDRDEFIGKPMLEQRRCQRRAA